MQIRNHILSSAQFVESPNADARPVKKLDLIVIHNISLPAGHFMNSFVPSLFMNRLGVSEHPDFIGVDKLHVSSHLFIRRDGSVIQFVPFDRRAWHAGESEFGGRTHCNDFSIGIELEGTDTVAFRRGQYACLAAICNLLLREYGIPRENIVGHADIAPGRKTDPGEAFEWDYFRKSLR